MAELPAYKKVTTEAELGEAYSLIANLTMPGREAEAGAAIHQIVMYAVRATLQGASGDLLAADLDMYKGTPRVVRARVAAVLSGWGTAL